MKVILGLVRIAREGFVEAFKLYFEPLVNLKAFSIKKLSISELRNARDTKLGEIISIMVLLALMSVLFVVDNFRSLRYLQTSAEFNEIVSLRVAAIEKGLSPLRPRPYVRARSFGPDLEIEAGLQPTLNSLLHPSAAWADQMADYPPGKYRLQNAPNAASLFDLIELSMEDLQNQKFKKSAKKIEIIGSADGLAVRDSLLYTGDLGLIPATSYYSYNEHSQKQLTLIPGRTILSNEDLAFLRAYDMMMNVRSVPALHNGEFVLSTTSSSEVGGKYRKVIVRIIVKDALEREYDELPSWLRLHLPK